MSQSLPIEALYVRQARRFVTAQHLQERAEIDSTHALRACAVEMHKVNVKAFDFVSHGVKHSATLLRPEASHISVRKLYDLFQTGQIDLNQFLDSVIASEQAVEQIIGPTLKQKVTEKLLLGLTLVIKPWE